MSMGDTRRFQLRLSLATFALVAGTFAGFYALSQSEAVAFHVFNANLARGQALGTRVMYEGSYADAGNYLLLEDLPKSDFSRGGAYFIGSSTMLHSPKIWDFTPDERKRVHNFSINSANIEEQFQWLRYLVEREGLLRAGGEKTLIVLGLHHFDSRRKLPGTRDATYVDDLFERHGLYHYQPDAGMSQADLPAAERTWLLVRARAQNVIQALRAMPPRQTAQPAPLPAQAAAPPLSDDGEQAVAEAMRYMDSDTFEQDMRFSMPILDRMLRYLAARHVRVVGVVLPVRGVIRRLPYHGQFKTETGRIFAAQGMPVVDLSALLGAEGFADLGHANLAGQDVIHPVLARLVREHLALSR